MGGRGLSQFYWKSSQTVQGNCTASPLVPYSVYFSSISSSRKGAIEAVFEWCSWGSNPEPLLRKTDVQTPGCGCRAARYNCVSKPKWTTFCHINVNTHWGQVKITWFWYKAVIYYKAGVVCWSLGHYKQLLSWSMYARHQSSHNSDIELNTYRAHKAEKPVCEVIRHRTLTGSPFQDTNHWTTIQSI